VTPTRLENSRKLGLCLETRHARAAGVKSKKMISDNLLGGD
jgi:hypothetical protein